MNNPYDLHSWSKLYCEEKLAEASRSHLAKRASACRDKPTYLRRVGLIWRSVLGPVRGGTRSAERPIAAEEVG